MDRGITRTATGSAPVIFATYVSVPYKSVVYEDIRRLN
jgi:hypothetical protein